MSQHGLSPELAKIVVRGVLCKIKRLEMSEADFLRQTGIDKRNWGRIKTGDVGIGQINARVIRAWLKR